MQVYKRLEPGSVRNTEFKVLWLGLFFKPAEINQGGGGGRHFINPRCPLYTGKPPPGSRNQWFICQLANGFILCCWLQVTGGLVTYYIIAQSIVLYSFSTYTEYCFVFSTYTTCRFVFSTYTKCRFVFSTYPQCRCVFTHTQSVVLYFQHTQSDALYSQRTHSVVLYFQPKQSVVSCYCR